MKYCFESLKRVPVWRLIVAAVWLLGMSLEVYGRGSNPPSFQEMVLSKLNDVTVFSFFFILLLIITDLGFNKEDNDAKSEVPSFLRQMAYAAFLSMLIIVLYIIFSLAIMLIIGGSVSFSNVWNRIDPFGFEWASPTLAMLIIIPLFFLRLVFLICLVSAVNSRSKKIPYGYAVGFAVCLINAIVYFQFMQSTAGGIFPFEHAYLESVFALSPSILLNIFISVLYWLLFIAAAGLIYRSGKPEKGLD